MPRRVRVMAREVVDRTAHDLPPQRLDRSKPHCLLCGDLIRAAATEGIVELGLDHPAPGEPEQRAAVAAAAAEGQRRQWLRDSLEP
jgi:hypothetical protein